MQVKFRISDRDWETFLTKTDTPAATIRELVINYNSMEHLIGVNEASELWGLSAGYIKNLCAEGKLRAKKIGQTWIIDQNQENPKTYELASK